MSETVDSAPPPDTTSFDALREAVGSTLMTDEQFFKEVDPGDPNEEVGIEAEDDAAALAAQVDTEEKSAAEKLEKTKEGLDELESGEAGTTSEKTKKEPDNADPGDEAAYEEALRALRRAKTPTDVIRKLSREQVLAWGQPLAKTQADTDKTYTELAALRAQASEAQKATRGATNAPDTEATASADLSAVQQKLAEVLGLDEEAGGVLREGLEALVRPLVSRLEERDQRDSRRDAAIAKLLLKSEAAGLVDRFPQLKEPAKFDAAAKRAMTLINTGSYASMADALEDAATLEFRDQVVQSGEKKALDRARGRMSAPSQRPKAVAAMSIDERLDAVLSGLDAGESEAAIRTRSGW